MTLRLSLSRDSHLTLISVYAPTMMHPAEVKELFYASLRDVIHSIPVKDKLLTLGDFNAPAGSNQLAWPGVLGTLGHGKENSNGLLLLSLCAEENLVITIFEYQEAHKVSCMHPWTKHWYILDYIITRRQDLSDILDTRPLRGADCWTDHILLCCKSRFKIHKPVRKKPSCIKKKLNVQSLKSSHVQDELKAKLAESLPDTIPLTATVEDAWASSRDAIFSSAEAALGFRKRKHHDWFDQCDQEILQLVEQKHSAHAAWLSDKNSASKHAQFKQLRAQVQRRTREMKNSWWAKKADEIQGHADRKRTKELSGLNFGTPKNATAPVRNSDGVLLTDKQDILKQWTLHFSSLLNRPSHVTDDTIESVQQRPIISELDTPPSMEETTRVVEQIQAGKAPGPDGIPIEIFKAGGHHLLEHLTKLFQLFWEHGQLPQDLRDANIIHLYKNKGDRSSCVNHRGISLLSIARQNLGPNSTQPYLQTPVG